jgi:hypothetical protein
VNPPREDRIFTLWPYTVELQRGLFRDTVLAYKDVRPALGGLLGRGRFKKSESDAKFDEAVSNIVRAK